jgi:hypothetical protein
MEISVKDFKDSGLYLLFSDGRQIVLTREKIESFARIFESNLDSLPVQIKGAVAFAACPVCPEKETAKFCHALPATMAFFEELKDFNSFDRVGAVYKGSSNALVLVPNITMQEALQYVAIYSLICYCEVGKNYWKYFLGIQPLMGPEEMLNRILLNVYRDCRGNQKKLDEVLRSFGSEITCTCQCQVERLRLVCKNDALINAFARTQAQIEFLAMADGDELEQLFAESAGSLA